MDGAACAVLAEDEPSDVLAAAVRPVLQGHIVVGGNRSCLSAMLLPCVFSAALWLQSDISPELKAKYTSAIMLESLGVIRCYFPQAGRPLG